MIPLAPMKHLDSLSLKKNDRLAIKETSDLLRQHFPVTVIKLFGSKARGEDDPESDIDLLVLTSKQLSWLERNAMSDAIFDTQLKHDVVLSLFVVSEEKWNKGILIAHPIHDTI